MEIIKTRTSSLCVFAVLILAGLLRVWSLQVVPPSPSLDEVSIGYNAFSLLHTGKDEYGYLMPLLLRAYDDWRPILYVYLTVPFVGVFGLNALSVRLPSVILSLGTIYLSFLLVSLLFKKGISVRGRELNITNIGIVTAFLISISPWQIYLSRLGHEVNLGLFMTVVSVFVFLTGVMRQKKYVFVSSAFLFALSFYTYQSQKVIIPILLLSLILLYFREIQRLGRTGLLAGVVFLLFVTPAVLVSFSPEGMTRFNGTSVFSANQSMYKESAEGVLRSKNENNFLGEIYYNRRFVPVRLITKQYFSHFNPEWLFSGSFRENHKAPYMGLLYLFEAPFLLLGIVVILFSQIGRKVKVLIAIWFLSGPLPGAITTDAPHAMRSFTLIPTLQIFEAVGLIFVFSLLRKQSYRFAAIGLFLLVVSVSLWQFSVNYFSIFPKTQANSFQSTLLTSMELLSEKQNQYDEIIVSNEKNLYQSYMFYLFASSYDPTVYQVSGGTRSGGFAKEHTIGHITFRPIRWNTEEKQARMMYIGNKEDFESGVEVKETFNYPDGKPGVYIVSYD